MASRLASATSPYLLAHATNPVDWWPWGDDAFEEARRRDVPVFVSIGYASCHWCHVMAGESFEDRSVAQRLNDRFVAIKVDREERPDVDAAYLRAAAALIGQAGWPLSVFTTPDGRPFYAGTYFPARPMGQVPAFTQVLDAVAAAWAGQRAEVLASAERISAHLSRLGAPDPSVGARMPGAPELAAVVDRLADEYDADHGGFGGAPKFPPSTILVFLARHHARTGDLRALHMLAGTCQAMARGGLYDQLGGGFARYSVDAGWVVPHFEKMLYDNASLLAAYLAWWRRSGAPMAARVVRETAAFLLTDLRIPQGGFASSLDADTLVPGPGGPRRVEGATYVWTPGELADVLGPDDGAWAADLLGVTSTGTFEHGTSTLRLTRPVDPPDAAPDDAARWARVRPLLQERRASRPAPARDDKVVAGWNGLAVAALAQAGQELGESTYVEAAEAAADVLLRVHWQPAAGLLVRTSRDGVPGPSAGLLEDYAGVLCGLASLARVTGNDRWARAGRAVAEQLADRFMVTTETTETAETAETIETTETTETTETAETAVDGVAVLADVAPRDADPRLAAIDPPGRPGRFDEQGSPSGRALAALAALELTRAVDVPDGSGGLEVGGAAGGQLAQVALRGLADLPADVARFAGGALVAAETLLFRAETLPG